MLTVTSLNRRLATLNAPVLFQVNFCVTLRTIVVMATPPGEAKLANESGVCVGNGVFIFENLSMKFRCEAVCIYTRMNSHELHEFIRAHCSHELSKYTAANEYQHV